MKINRFLILFYDVSNDVLCRTVHVTSILLTINECRLLIGSSHLKGRVFTNGFDTL